MSVSLIVGSIKVKKGIEYNGIVSFGNAFRMSDNTKISVNNGDFVSLKVQEDVYALIDFTYTFEKDTVVILTRIAEDNLSVVYNSKCSNSFTLVVDTESAEVCTLTLPDDVATGDLQVIAKVQHKKNEDVIMTIYKNATLYDTVTKTWSKNGKLNITYHKSLIGTLTKDDIFTFKLEAKGQDAELISTIETPSQIQVIKFT